MIVQRERDDRIPLFHGFLSPGRFPWHSFHFRSIARSSADGLSLRDYAVHLASFEIRELEVTA